MLASPNPSRQGGLKRICRKIIQYLLWCKIISFQWPSHPCYWGLNEEVLKQLTPPALVAAAIKSCRSQQLHFLHGHACDGAGVE